MKIGKRQIILASLVLALGAAVYLNWQLSDNNLVKANADEVIGQAQLVNNQTDKPVSDKESGDKANESKSTDEYFADVRTNRQKVQDETVDLAKEVLEAASSDEAAKIQAVKDASQIANIYQQQSNIEGLIKAKGFSDCVVFIQNSECSVVLKKAEMNDETNIVIKDIVNGQSGIEVDRIKITGV
ncbi:MULTISPECIES: SpoIIIAH-like family protein [unclassified Ruminococcus]|uniref:SpoIIIAH-like family protein n=1 Tax=unclassified Ruminococcus TaxID=2608920 RepID=UPI002108FA47|nr:MULTISPECIES: SpoIIIAH-like family protein [unclassified Ruminococcus]MCQ4022084.1 SpoIIIAH-like family protein [Ruminococcus sp. zg-924]MCQ4114404.1 SpoIIIAH-like family protein [Ruminococcus sp. zg-921]